MEELPRLKASRRGYRAHITKIYSKIIGITDSTEPITRVQRIALSTALEQLQQKQTILKELDTKIVNGMTEEEELAQEICDIEEYQTILVEKISFVRDFLETTVSPLTPLSPPTVTKTYTLPTSSFSTSSPPRPGVATENPSEANTPSTETLPETNIEPGDLLTRKIYGWLPREVQKNLARDHDDGEWTIDELRSGIMKEIPILETEIHSSGCHNQPIHSDAPAMMTASFYMDTQQHPHSLAPRNSQVVFTANNTTPLALVIQLPTLKTALPLLR